MRKSLILMVVMLAAFSVERAHAFCSQNPCCCLYTGVKERSLEFNVGYRRDYIHWKFKDPSLNLIQAAIPLLVGVVCDDESSTSNNGDFIGTGLIGAAITTHIANNDVYRNLWKDLRMINVGGTARALTCENMYARFGGNWACVVDGKYKSKGLFAGCRDDFDDFFSDCGIAPTQCRRVCGHTWDVSGAIGYQMCLCDNDFKLAPLIGWAYHNLDIHTDADSHRTSAGAVLIDILDQSDAESSTIEGKSRIDYCNHWNGPYIGFDVTYSCDCRLNWYGNFEYHWATFHGNSKIKRDTCVNFVFEEQGGGGGGQVAKKSNKRLKVKRNRSLSSDNSVEEIFVDDISRMTFDHDSCFTQRACARGLFWSLGADYNFCDCWWAGFKFTWMDWKTFKNGRVLAKAENCDEIQLQDENANGSSTFTYRDTFCKDTGLKRVHWNSYRFELTINRFF